MLCADPTLDMSSAEGDEGLVPTDNPLEGPGLMANDEVDEDAPTPANEEK